MSCQTFYHSKSPEAEDCVVQTCKVAVYKGNLAYLKIMALFQCLADENHPS